jgi:hypothetical protein
VTLNELRYLEEGLLQRGERTEENGDGQGGPSVSMSLAKALFSGLLAARKESAEPASPEPEPVVIRTLRANNAGLIRVTPK